jgi:hypothetical protein
MSTRTATPSWDLPPIKTRSEEPNHPYNPTFSEANRNESRKGREVIGPG